jgi:hypothetical protein
MRKERLKKVKLVIVFALLLMAPPFAGAQEAASPTPLQINLVTPTPAVAQESASVTPTWTATTPPLAVLEAIDTANVRAEANINGALLGQIRSGETYTVSGRYFEWYQFEYPQSPNGRAWVFGQLVRITGDPNTILEITDEPLPTLDPLIAGATETINALLAIPGGDLTATEGARGVVSTLVIPGVVNGGRATEMPAGTSLPTYTFPPGIVREAATSAPSVAATEEPALELNETLLTTLPPIIPILALGVLGILGLIFSARGRR